MSGADHAQILRRVLLLPSAGIGGAEVHAAWLAQSLAAAGVTLRLAIGPALRERFAALLSPALAPALQAAPVGWDPEASAAENQARQSAAAAALLRDWRPDAAVLPLPWPTHALGLQQALAEAAVPVLAVAHLAPRQPEAEVVALAHAAVLGPTRWIAVSDPVAARLAACFGLPDGAVASIPNGVVVPPWDPARRLRARAAKRQALGLPDRARLLVFAGRLELDKGADLLPATAALLRARACPGAPPTVLVALGEGSLRRELARHPAARATATGREPAGVLRLAGQVADVGEWLLAADALLLPSRLEGCPLVFLEAAAHRCPVVATAAALEAFGEAAPGLAAMVPEANAASLADRVETCLAEPLATQARVAAAWRRVVAHDRAAMLRRYAGLLRALPAGGPVDAPVGTGPAPAGGVPVPPP